MSDEAQTWTSFDAAAAGRGTARLVAEGVDLDERWRLAISQVIDIYELHRRHGQLDDAVRMFAATPGLTGDRRIDAAIAALCEYLAARDGWKPPKWTKAECRYSEPWYLTEYKVFQRLADEAPVEAFQRHGVRISAETLVRV